MTANHGHWLKHRETSEGLSILGVPIRHSLRTEMELALSELPEFRRKVFALARRLINDLRDFNVA